jgi:hypothetical protein
VKCNNSSFGELLFSLFWDWFCERSLEVHQIRPVYFELIWVDDTLAFHSSIPIYYFGCTYKYLLWITSTKSTRTAKWPRVYYCNSILQNDISKPLSMLLLLSQLLQDQRSLYQTYTHQYIVHSIC